jgi:hypothetical protein
MIRGTGGISERPWFLALICLGLPACQGPEPEADPARQVPASVLVRPVAGGKKSVVDPMLLARQVADGLRQAQVFSEVKLEGEEDAEAGGPDGTPDYICALEASGTGFRPDISEATNRAFLSSFLWFLAIFPAWWIDDRVYNGSDVVIQAHFTRAGAAPSDRRILEEVVPTNQLELDLLRRGATWQFFLSIILPPFWMDSAAKAGESLPIQAAASARTEIAERARKDWPRAALLAEPGAFLMLDPPASADGLRRKADLAGWILARAPLFEVRVMDQGRREILRIDRAGLQKLTVPLAGTGADSRRLKELIDERLGGATPLIGAAYRLDLRGLPVGGSSRVHVTSRLGPEAPPATFTITLEK